MSILPETSLSLLSNPTHPPRPGTSPEFSSSSRLWVEHSIMRCSASPARLAPVLVSALADVENKYLAGVENGVLSAEVDFAEKLAVLQLEVSTLRETSLRSSLSPLSAFYDTFNICRSVALLRCLRRVRGLETIIEISHETQLREIACCQCPLANRASISLRRRNTLRSLET
ncbi:hypothetical protein MSAN_00676400 [Mycena sanguinolenta]|uniref:Uncharacterized protein n=1 Tax=Mycena sanguinolenta TaxID=230812 RepID=A0A8H6Z497_9AGAR|nr:hypothetical protein MSAN_00676400 [Mycena sanguinolenta]